MDSEIALKGSCIGKVLIQFRELDSTNEKAHQFAEQGGREGTVIIADRQTRGRGRRRNLWHSPEGGLYCSVILRPHIMPDETELFEKMAGVAVWETIAQLLPSRPVLKAPNDVLINGKKVSGILIETRVSTRSLAHLVMGIGINCTGDPDSFQPELHGKVTTLSKECGHCITPAEVLHLFLAVLDRWYAVFGEGKSGLIVREWERLVGEGSGCPACS